MYGRATSGDVQAFALLMGAAEAQEIELDHPEVRAGLEYWLSVGVLTPERIAEILA